MKFQKSEILLLPKTIFKALVKQIAKDQDLSYKFQKEAYEVLQWAA